MNIGCFGSLDFPLTYDGGKLKNSICRYFNKTVIEMFLENPCISYIFLARCSFVLGARETQVQKNGKILKTLSP